MADLQNTSFSSTDSFSVTPGSRPANPTAGMLHSNTTTGDLEFYDGIRWSPINESHPIAKGGFAYDIEEGGVVYTVHVFTPRSFQYVSDQSAAQVGFNPNPVGTETEAYGEVDQLGGCSGNLTFEQALEWVHSRGVRLLTRQEMLDRYAAANTGCGYDATLNWTCDKANDSGSVHYVAMGYAVNHGRQYVPTNNTSTATVRYVADVDLDRKNPVQLNDPFMYDWLKANYPNSARPVDRFTVERGGEMEVMIVAGGGGGGPTDGSGAAGGGGGAGGVIHRRLIVTPGDYTITPGLGGTGDRTIFGQEYGQNGGNSTAFGYTAIGGGGGGSRDVTGRNGGSGGGDNRTNGTSGTGVAGQGFAGGGGGNNVSPSAGGGGGGATQLGQNVYSLTDNNGGQYYGGKGGNGRYTNITGMPIWFAGGGGGGNGWTDLSGKETGYGGMGGGGAGGDSVDRSASTSRALAGYDAANFTGSGGGGTAGTNTKAGDGGDGIVIIKYRKNITFNNNETYSVTTKNLFFEVDAAKNGTFGGPRRDHSYWYDTVAGSRGTINGAIKFENPGSIQASPQFDGNNKYVRFDLGASYQLYGLEMWAYNDDAVPNNDTAIGGPTTYQSMVNYNTNQNLVNLGAWTGTATNEAVHIWNSSTMTYNRDYVYPGWHHYFFQWDGSRYQIWIDGFRTETYPRSNGHATLIDNLNTIDIGGNIASVYMFQGRIPVVRMYDGPVSNEEIENNFKALRWRYGV